MLGSAMPTTVASIAAMPEPRTVARMIQRPGGVPYRTPAAVPLTSVARPRPGGPRRRPGGVRVRQPGTRTT